MLDRLNTAGLTVNKDKCEFLKTKIKFFGMVFSSEGVEPDECKIKAIKEAAKPSTVGEVRSILGLMNYCSRFIKDYANLSKPLYELTQNKIKSFWMDSHDNSNGLL